MKYNNTLLRMALVGVALCAAATAQAGIFRDMMGAVGLAKPEPPVNDANGIPSYPRQGFACCVLHYNKLWISDSNVGASMIAAGTPIEVTGYASNRAHIKIDGKNMELGHDYGRETEALDAWVRKMVVNQDPRPKFTSFAPTVQEAIRLGKVMVGMTREQCIVAVGYPLTNENVTLDGPTWRMKDPAGTEYQLNFGRDGRLMSVTGDVETTYAVTYKPGGK
jgi:hypothetical protein